MPDALEDVQRRAAPTRPTYQSSIGGSAGASSAAFTSASASMFCSRRHVREVDLGRTRRAAPAASLVERPQVRLLHLPRALELADHEHRVGAQRRPGARRTRGAASSPAITARYSATLLVATPMRSLTVARPVGRRRSTGRGRPRRSRPGRGSPATHRRAYTSMHRSRVSLTGPGCSRSCRSTRSCPAAPCGCARPRSAGSRGDSPGRSCRPAGPHRRRAPACAAARTPRRRSAASSVAIAARAARSVAISPSIVGLVGGERRRAARRPRVSSSPARACSSARTLSSGSRCSITSSWRSSRLVR